MTASSALKRLAEQVALISSEYRRLKKRCTELERKIEKLSGKFDKLDEPADRIEMLHSDLVESGSSFDREQVKAKLEEMLAELADIG